MKYLAGGNKANRNYSDSRLPTINAKIINLENRNVGIGY